MCGAQGDAQPACALRNRRRTDGGNKVTSFSHPFTHLERRSFRPECQGENGCLRGCYIEARLAQPALQSAKIFPEGFPAKRFVTKQLQALQGRASRGGWQSRGKDE